MSNSFVSAGGTIPLLTPPGRVGLVGAGAFGRFCIDAYQKSADIEVLAVADPDSNALALVDTSTVRPEADWRRLVDDPAIEVLHLATPPYLRREIVMTALEAGKSVFCEKPLALTLADADAMIAAARRTGVALGVNYVMRYHMLYKLFLRLSVSGLMGALHTLSFENYAQNVPAGHWFWDPVRSGGIFVEHGVHFFDVLGQVAGPPDSVWAAAPGSHSVEATVQYRSGAVGRYYHEFAFPREIEYASSTALFDRGRLRLEGWIPTDLQGEVLAPAEAVLMATPEVRIQPNREKGSVTRFYATSPDRQTAYRDAIAAGMRDVVHRHRDPTWDLVVPPEAARASLALAIAAQTAIEKGSIVSCAVAE